MKRTPTIMATAAAVAATSLAFAGGAVAAPVDIGDTSAAMVLDNTAWWVGNWGEDYGFTISDAAVWATAAEVDPNTTMSAVSGDAFDGALSVLINGTAVGETACVNEGCEYIVDISTSGGDAVVTAPTEVLSGLDIDVQHRYYSAGDLARVLVALHNPTAAPISTVLGAYSNYGSDEETVLEADSSGDDAVSAADRWFITGDGGFRDPVVTTVWGGPGSQPPVVGALANPALEQFEDDSLAQFNVTVAPGATVYLAFFVAIQPPDNGVPAPTTGDLAATVPIAPNYAAAVAASVTAASQFGTLSGRLAAGIPAGAAVVNWDAAPAVPVVVAPAFTG